MKLLRMESGNKKVRIEDAIYFSDGKAALLAFSPDLKCKVTKFTTLEKLESDNPNSWADIYENYVYENSKFIATAGETSYGGAGFITLFSKEKNEYIWILHLNQCNNFNSITIKDDVVITTSDYFFPNGTEFKLPIINPLQIEIKKL